MSEPKAAVETIEHNDNSTIEWQGESVKDNAVLQQAAAEGNLREHELNPLQTLKMYPLAVMWCLIISTTVIMEGYDTILLGNLYAYPTFQRKYGEWVGVTDSTRSGYQLEAKWQAALGNGSGIGAFFGTLLNGYLVGLFGHRKVTLGALVMLSAFIFITFFAQTKVTLLIGQILVSMSLFRR